MANQVTIKNKTAHVKQLNLGGGGSITIPPTAEGSPGLAVTFDSDKEHERFKAALGSAVVKRWIERKELEVESGAAAADEAGEAPATKPPPPPPPPAPAPAEPTPSRHFGRRGDRE
jgi:hypothetical protein